MSLDRFFCRDWTDANRVKFCFRIELVNRNHGFAVHKMAPIKWIPTRIWYMHTVSIERTHWRMMHRISNTLIKCQHNSYIQLSRVSCFCRPIRDGTRSTDWFDFVFLLLLHFFLLHKMQTSMMTATTSRCRQHCPRNRRPHRVQH